MAVYTDGVETAVDESPGVGRVRGVSGKANASRSAPYIVLFDVCIISAGSTTRAILSKHSPIAMSFVEPRTRWSVKDAECMSNVWPPDARTDRNGNLGGSSVVVGS